MSSRLPEVLVLQTSVLEPCVLVLRCSQQRYYGIIGVGNGDIAGGEEEVWEQPISELKKRFTFGGRWEVGKENSVAKRLFKQQMDPCVLPVFFKSLDFVPLGK